MGAFRVGCAVWGRVKGRSSTAEHLCSNLLSDEEQRRERACSRKRWVSQHQCLLGRRHRGQVWADVIAGKSNRRTAAPTFNLRCFGHCVRLTEQRQGLPDKCSTQHQAVFLLPVSMSVLPQGRQSSVCRSLPCGPLEMVPPARNFSHRFLLSGPLSLCRSGDSRTRSAFQWAGNAGKKSHA